jgi:hypothetical protein
MYSITYSPEGIPTGIRQEIGQKITFIPLDESNADFREFVKWNNTQNVPLDWRTPIAPIAEDIVLRFDMPVQAPDFLVATPAINPDPEKAFDEAIAEMKKKEGNSKSIALMVLSLTKYLESKKAKLK